ncbi:hypothetical protein [Altericista sp. CCNU0014]|uniref:hypothetical protein n=1 Tax=Altericista sp. CCNU0014 TaxID=3082949 RepID=UPI00384F1D9C
MSEQYAFAIGFDFESNSDGMGGQPEAETTPMAEVGAAIRNAGLPDIESERWDEFGCGRIFWGTRSECETVKQVLSQFELFLQEERNLDPGYYATAASTYYADESGNLYRLLDVSNHSEIGSLEPVTAIPLDAYRLQAIDPNLQAAVERSLLSAFSPPTEPSPPSELPEIGTTDRKDPPAIADAVPLARPLEAELAELRDRAGGLIAEIEALQMASDAKTIEAEARQNELQSQIALQATQIYDLERQVTSFEDRVMSLQSIAAVKEEQIVSLQSLVAAKEEQIVALQSMAAAKIDPQLHADRQEELNRQIQQLEAQLGRIQPLEARLAQAEARAKDWQDRAESALDPQERVQLQQQLDTQTAKAQELQQIVQRLEQQLQETTAIAAQKIEPAKYEALEQSIADKTALIGELRQDVHQLQRDLSEWQTVAESKVEWTVHEALQEDFRQLQAQQKKGLFSRLLGWLFG